MIRSRYGRGALVLAVTFTALGAAPASAEESSDLHCVARVDAYEISGVVHPEAGAGELTCLPTLAAAISFATDGRVEFPANVTQAEVRRDLDSRLSASDNAYPDGYTSGNTVIGIDYDTNWIDEELIWQTSHTNGCFGGTEFQRASMPNGWHNKVDHASAHQGCDQYIHFEHENFGEPKITCTCEDMHSMTNKTSSEKWRRAEPPRQARQGHYAHGPSKTNSAGATRTSHDRVDGPAGTLCGHYAVSDPAPEAAEDAVTGVMYAGPVLAVGEITCSIQVDHPLHLGPDAPGGTARGGSDYTGVAWLFAQVTFAVPDNSQLYVCTEWRPAPDSQTVLYWRAADPFDPFDPFAPSDGGEWTDDSSAACETANQVSTAPIVDAVDDILRSG